MKDKVRVIMDEQTQKTLESILDGLSDALSPLHELGEIGSSLRDVQDRVSEIGSQTDDIKITLEKLQRRDTAGTIGALADAFSLPTKEWLSI
jgi:hypothetical protein